MISTLKKIVRRIDRSSPYPFFYPLIMSKNEKKALDNILKKTTKYLEFGAGGSTIRALRKSKAEIHCVESSKPWIEYMRNYFPIRHFENKRLHFHLVDIGKTKLWGYPEDDSSKHLFPEYSSGIFKSLDPQTIDTFFIDGRFRVACALSVILHTHSFDTSNTKILIHDFSEREHYQAVLKYFDVIEMVDTLAILRIKEDINIQEVEKDYEMYKFDSR